MTTLHLVGGPSAGEVVCAVLDDSDRAADSIEWFPDNLNSGPLEPDDYAARVEWWSWHDDMVRTEFPEFDPTRVGTLPDLMAAFWARAEQADHLVVWYGRDNAQESAMFHEICHRLPDRPLDVVEVPVAVPFYSPHELAYYATRARPITDAERTRVHETWQRLRQENETFRVVEDGNLVSAPADHYDKALLYHVRPEWTPLARAIAPVMAGMKADDAILKWRMKSLIESGSVLADGSPWLSRRTKVKRP
ncbi:DUF3658 domain-containing protein [Nocardia sp. CDC160]|uniref:DUF3658 domain-containing protein n=1 Tax=Nocardia sp. CDC160 TaxID=3112166 RepID=UPI002DB6F2B2|nr:DUF3658 domain-containing protein [Nocardia sp. CDC160]MEC3914418.1 DUF3658 domain-containing protein [Nocardia sp. CDC160]